MEMEVLAIVMVFSLFALILGGIPVPFALAVSGLVFGLIGFGSDLFNLLPLSWTKTLSILSSIPPGKHRTSVIPKVACSLFATQV